jgi:serine/threonine-protein kinase RsbW
VTEVANVCLKLSSRAENVLVVRQALTGFSEALGLDAVETNDLTTAVTEACNNVVLHAYDEDGEGPMEVEICAQRELIAVTTRDHGHGIEAHALDAMRPGESGIGLPVMQALAQQVSFKKVPGGGTEVRMEFAAPRADGVEPVEEEWEPPVATRALLEGTVEMTLAPSSVARSVLPRVLSALAARAYFTTDRIADVELVADALVAEARDSIVGSHLGVGVELAPRNLELRVGPLREGQAQEIIDASRDRVGPVLERLTDHQRVAVADHAEVLALRMLQHR